jgi:hypothetical protein
MVNILYLCGAIALMCRNNYMKRVKCIAPVDSISGMIGKRSDFVSGAAFISNVRKHGGAATKGASFMYFAVRTRDRVSAVSAQEKVWRQKFGEISRQTRENLMDPQTIQTLNVYYFENKHKYYSLYHAAWDWTRLQMEENA